MEERSNIILVAAGIFVASVIIGGQVALLIFAVSSELPVVGNGTAFITVKTVYLPVKDAARVDNLDGTFEYVKDFKTLQTLESGKSYRCDARYDGAFAPYGGDTVISNCIKVGEV